MLYDRIIRIFNALRSKYSVIRYYYKLVSSTICSLIQYLIRVNHNIYVICLLDTFNKIMNLSDNITFYLLRGFDWNDWIYDLFDPDSEFAKSDKKILLAKLLLALWLGQRIKEYIIPSTGNIEARVYRHIFDDVPFWCLQVITAQNKRHFNHYKSFIECDFENTKNFLPEDADPSVPYVTAEYIHWGDLELDAIPKDLREFVSKKATFSGSENKVIKDALFSEHTHMILEKMGTRTQIHAKICAKLEFESIMATALSLLQNTIGRTGFMLSELEVALKLYPEFLKRSDKRLQRGIFFSPDANDEKIKSILVARYKVAYAELAREHDNFNVNIATLMIKIIKQEFASSIYCSNVWNDELEDFFRKACHSIYLTTTNWDGLVYEVDLPKSPEPSDYVYPSYNKFPQRSRFSKYFKHYDNSHPITKLNWDKSDKFDPTLYYTNRVAWVSSDTIDPFYNMDQFYHRLNELKLINDEYETYLLSCMTETYIQEEFITLISRESELAEARVKNLRNLYDGFHGMDREMKTVAKIYYFFVDCLGEVLEDGHLLIDMWNHWD